ncbi:ABC transporter permease [Acetobacter thailandicus]|nr:ABC transporter permease [Acetobacter thailandicus]MBS0980849.1 ABC transporter permease [Acetobacter thailandicus]MBS0985819.1 ABC transporter permease [Acetobacter thailandicus]MBS1004395.1 ABC transporter permease [Acetobacter thailandicus]
MVLYVGGNWNSRSDDIPVFNTEHLNGGTPCKSCVIDTQALGRWDSGFISFLWDVKQKVAAAQLELDDSALPPAARNLLSLLPQKAVEVAADYKKPLPFFEKVGDKTLQTLEETGTLTDLGIQTVKGTLQALRGKSRMRVKDLATDIWNAGPSALLIVGIVNFLIGAILAFVGLIELRRFAAEIYVANLVGIACAREISAIMTAIIMAGRTGGAYAARISTMQANEEIDALQVFGIPVSTYILLPSILSLSVMMPVLYVYGTLIAILGGFVVSMTMMSTSAIGYWVTTINGVSLHEFVFGFVKAFFFAGYIGLTSCRVGLKAGRSAADVGIAATRAVVIGIVGIIAMDAVFAVIAKVLDF